MASDALFSVRLSIAGLRCKREIWRIHTVLSKMRSIARVLLTLPEKVRGCQCGWAAV